MCIMLTFLTFKQLVCNVDTVILASILLIMSVPDEIFFQKRSVISKFDIFICIPWSLCFAFYQICGFLFYHKQFIQQVLCILRSCWKKWLHVHVLKKYIINCNWCNLSPLCKLLDVYWWKWTGDHVVLAIGNQLILNNVLQFGGGIMMLCINCFFK